MKASVIALGAMLLAAAGARAQLLNEPASKPRPFAGSFQPYPRVYGGNDTPAPLPGLFDDYRADPKLYAGLDLGSYLAIETGYQNLKSRGIHYVDAGRADERANALGTRGFATHAAVKLTVPLAAGLSTYGKLGVAYSEDKYRDPRLRRRVPDSDTGPYASVGARYQLKDNVSLSGQVERHGDTARKFGSDTNANGGSAKLKIGF